MIRFRCEGCGRPLSVSDSGAGKRGRCPHCRQVVRVPQTQAGPLETESEHPDAPDTKSGPSARDLNLLDFPHEPAQTDEAPAPNAATDRPETDAPPVNGDAQTDNDQETDDEAPPSLMDALLYPANLDGLVQIGFFAAGLWGIALLGRLLYAALRLYTGIVILLLRVLLGGYILFYLGYCIFDSSKGDRRAPPVSTAHTPDKWDIVGQLLLLLGSIAICFWPAALYRGLTGQLDMWYWALAALGAFHLPMALLVGTLFDGIAALNPLTILRSIFATLPVYIVLLLKLAILGGALAAVYRVSGQFWLFSPLRNAVCLYLLLIGSYLLGHFYWKQKHCLQWGL